MHALYTIASSNVNRMEYLQANKILQLILLMIVEGLTRSVTTPY